MPLARHEGECASGNYMLLAKQAPFVVEMKYYRPT